MGAEREPFSPYRYRFFTEPTTPVRPTAHEGPLGAMAEAAANERMQRDGVILRAARQRLQLGLEEVAAGWGLGAAELGELERGLRRFKETDDMDAALRQLWLWHMERRQQGLASSRGGV